MPEYVWKNSLFFWKNSLSLSILLSIYIQDWGADFANGRVTLGEMGMGTRRLVFLGLSLGLCFRAWSQLFSHLKPLSAVPQHHQLNQLGYWNCTTGGDQTYLWLQQNLGIFLGDVLISLVAQFTSVRFMPLGINFSFIFLNF